MHAYMQATYVLNTIDPICRFMNINANKLGRGM